MKTMSGVFWGEFVQTLQKYTDGTKQFQFIRPTCLFSWSSWTRWFCFHSRKLLNFLLAQIFKKKQQKNRTEYLPASLVKMNIFAMYTFICHICHVSHRYLIARGIASSNETWSLSETGMKRADDEDFIVLWLGVETLKLKAFILLTY